MPSIPLVEQIMQTHCAAPAAVKPGSIVTLRVDQIYVQDGNSPTIARLVHENGFSKLPYGGHAALFFDHSVLSPESAMTGRLRDAQAFARTHGLRVFRPGEGISHVVALEQGWYIPGTIVVGADSHTCTGGVMQCLALGLGASDVLGAMLTGAIWAKVPRTRWVHLRGRPGPYSGAKDVMLYLAAKFGNRELLYQSVEWVGEWLESLSTDSAATVANMAVELGAKCSFLPPGPGRRHLSPLELGPAEDSIEINLDGLPPFVAQPHSPERAVELDACAGTPIDYVFVGSCANSRLEDICMVVDTLAGRKVHPDVHMVVTPGSRAIYLSAVRDGLVEALINAGALVTPPGCGSCVGTQGTIPSDEDRVLSTMNRNFIGRMGNPLARIWLSSPRIAAETAVQGRIPRLADLKS